MHTQCDMQDLFSCFVMCVDGFFCWTTNISFLIYRNKFLNFHTRAVFFMNPTGDLYIKQSYINKCYMYMYIYWKNIHVYIQSDELIQPIAAMQFDVY